MQLYRKNTYLMQADTTITGIKTLENGNTALSLTDLLFFPGGGGQPKETTGKVILRGQPFQVADLIKHNGDVLVALNTTVPFHAELKKGEAACQCLDVKRRLQAARYHTLQHVYSAAARIVVPGYETRGMEIADNLTQCRMNFKAAQPLTYSMTEDIQELVLSALADDLPVFVLNYASVEQVRSCYGVAFRLDSTLPPFKGNRLRTIVIGDSTGSIQDASLCGGTHVQSLAEIEPAYNLHYGTGPNPDESFLGFWLRW